jgi:neutral ceramidase
LTALNPAIELPLVAMTPRVLPPVSRRRFLKNTAASLAALSFCTAASGHAAGRHRLLLAGASKRRVTPPLCVPYLTSSGNGTNAPFQGIHDDLFARALVLDAGQQKLALLSVDAIGYDNSILGPHRDFTRELRRHIAARTGLKPDAIMLAATHAHSAPETIGLTPFREVPGVPEWLESHLLELVETVVDAWKARAPARAFAGTTQVQGIARYRRIVLKNGKLSVHGSLPPPDEVAVPWQLDETLSLLWFERENGAPCAALMNYTAHPVIAMLLPQVCADYPGAAATLVEQQLPGVVCVFTNGAAGNVNSLKVSTNFDDVALLGGKLGAAALDRIAAFRASRPLADTGLEVRCARFELAPRRCPPLAQALKAASATAIGKDGTLTRLAMKLGEGPLRGELQGMRLGPVRWLSLPGEPFVETGLALKRTGASFVVGYANGYLGYLPTRRAYEEGGYEVVLGAWSRAAPGSAERLGVIGQKLLQRLGNPSL